ncbi:hypothetical protein Pyn_30266 [Prunus yedoensis var. nudiflora]|uniref:Uncharacterized protein n=1 Tax=Prunus yedoensis var. nudiflora TaxID=2094558 RepID=A0A314UFL7_PRUYE|nr:hypothetical protein Pyn_30266 [Prunus yedoensis var. nudiflora]
MSMVVRHIGDDLDEVSTNLGKPINLKPWWGELFLLWRINHAKWSAFIHSGRFGQVRWLVTMQSGRHSSMVVGLAMQIGRHWWSGQPCKVVGDHAKVVGVRPKWLSRPCKVAGDHAKWSAFIHGGRVSYARWWATM